ncbi:MAG: cupin domain-containing protein [Syntrophales bacterium]|nr:cupin domain-containing protein [Syntrophales bacterium]
MKHTDPLSEVLMLLNPRAAFSSSLETGGDWAIQFNGYASVKFCAVTRGSCWLNADSLDEPIRLNFGDCFLLSDGTPYLLASDLCISPDHASKVFENAVDGYTRWGNGNDVVIIGGRFDFEGEDAFLLLDTLPAVIHIASNSPHSNVIQWVLNQLSLELSVSSIGSSLMADNLAHILIVQVLRSFLGSKNKPPTGWLNALADPKINIALCLSDTSGSCQALETR